MEDVGESDDLFESYCFYNVIAVTTALHNTQSKYDAFMKLQLKYEPKADDGYSVFLEVSGKMPTKLNNYILYNDDLLSNLA